jgi:hypothetical protein
MNEKTPTTPLGNINKKELKKLKELVAELKDTSAKNPHKKETIRDRITDLRANLGLNESKGGKGNYTPKGIKKMPPISREMAKGGEVKKYMGGGSVHKNKKNMITTKGWGASRKT